MEQFDEKGVKRIGKMTYPCWSHAWNKFTNLFNPLLPNGNISSRIAKILISIYEGIITKISYGRR